MLVLSRKPGQRIVAGNVTITVTKIKGDRVSIGIEAPRDVQVLRGELPRHQPGNLAEDKATTA